jgi:hypothetical protein
LKPPNRQKPQAGCGHKEKDRTNEAKGEIRERSHTGAPHRGRMLIRGRIGNAFPRRRTPRMQGKGRVNHDRKQWYDKPLAKGVKENDNDFRLAALIGRPIARTRRTPEPVGHLHRRHGLRTVPVTVQKPLYSACVVG